MLGKRTIIPLLLIIMLAGGCERIFEGEGDCSVTYMVNFRYDYNMEYEDEFTQEVEGVTLYVIDSGTGKIIWQKTESGAALSQAGYAMEADVSAGTYDLLVWGWSGNGSSWSIPASSAYNTDLTSTLNLNHDAQGNAYSDTDIDRLYYGYVAGQDFGTKPIGVHTCTVPLVKDVNNIRVVLQYESGEMVDKDNFTFTLTDNNGSLDWDNSVLGDETITYYPWQTEQGEPEIDSRADDGLNAAVAKFTVGRLMQSHNDYAMLTVTNNTTRAVVASIPFIQMFDRVKSYEAPDLDNQEYLDRQDDYSIVLFLDNGDRWVNTYIYINSWRVVLQNSGLQN